MNTKAQSIVASMLEVATGVWVMLVPAFTSVTGGALVSTLIAGGVIVAAGLIQLFWENILPSWIDGITALWIFISAYALNVSSAVTWNLVTAAVIAFLLALWDGTEVSELHHAHHQR